MNDWCLEDDCASSVCGGPHYTVLGDDGPLTVVKFVPVDESEDEW